MKFGKLHIENCQVGIIGPRDIEDYADVLTTKNNGVDHIKTGMPGARPEKDVTPDKQSIELKT